MTFNEAFAQLIAHEGGYTADPKDRGNWTTGVIGKGELKGTKYGISAMAYPNLNIKGLTLEDAKAIYYRDYWQAAGCELVPTAIKFDLFDMAVNSGVATAIKTLQRAVGALDDGNLGPKSMAAIAATSSALILARFNGHRLLFMTKTPAWATYHKGWATRIAINLIGAT